MQKRPMHLFFDIDDTLFPSTEFAELARKNAIDAMVEQGFEGDKRRMHSTLLRIIGKKGSNYPHVFDDLCRELGIKRPSRFVAAAVAAYHDTKSSIAPFPEVPRVLLRLRENGYSLYAATNGNAVKQWDKLIRMGIELYFEDVFVSEEMGEEKSPGFFKKVMKRLGLKPGECAMIGDREDKDILPAKKAGMLSIRVRRGKYAKGNTAAEFEIKNLKELEKTLGH